MSKLFWKALKLSPVFLTATLALADRTLAQSVTPSPPAQQRVADKPAQNSNSQTTNELQQIDQYNQAPSGSQTTNTELQQIDHYNQAPTAPVAQVTSVSQLSDVQPTDWAFQALQSLVERYGCIAGYPDGTYRGNRALTRYEFAAGLNACLDRVNELIAAGTSDLVRKEDLATLQRLQEEFAAELATLRGRVDSLEARTAELEANQFSTTTKLSGEAIFAVNGIGIVNNRRAVPTRRRQGSDGTFNNNETFTDRVRLALNTSFTGRDLLRTRLQARNTNPFGVSNTGTNMTRLGFDGDEGNTVFVDQLFYRFPITKNAIIQIDAANVELSERGFPTFSPFESSGTGSISRYGRFSPIYRAGDNQLVAGGNTSNNFFSSAGPGVSLHVNPQGAIGFDLAYLAPAASNPNHGFGIGNGSYAAVGQIDINASKYFNLGLTYSHTYDSLERRNGVVNILDNTGSILAGEPFGNTPTSANNYGVEASFRPSKNLIAFGWGGYTQAYAEHAFNNTGITENGTTARLNGPRGSQADIWYYAGGLAFPDLGRQGSLLGLLFGQQPRLAANRATETFNGITRRRVDGNVSYQAEAFYRYRLTDNIDLTPGVLIIFQPEGNYRNPTDYVGTLRTTFRF